jgi:hypothetical protein
MSETTPLGTFFLVFIWWLYAQLASILRPFSRLAQCQQLRHGQADPPFGRPDDSTCVQVPYYGPKRQPVGIAELCSNSQAKALPTSVRTRTSCPQSFRHDAQPVGSLNLTMSDRKESKVTFLIPSVGSFSGVDDSSIELFVWKKRTPKDTGRLLASDIPSKRGGAQEGRREKDRERVGQ